MVPSLLARASFFTHQAGGIFPNIELAVFVYVPRPILPLSSCRRPPVRPEPGTGGASGLALDQARLRARHAGHQVKLALGQIVRLRSVPTAEPPVVLGLSLVVGYFVSESVEPGLKRRKEAPIAVLRCGRSL